jgi:chemotaxis family two-component system response regulator Rcp1
MSVRNGPSAARILLVEDNPGDVELAKEALRASKLHNELWVANDGSAALEVLRKGEETGDLPDLVFLDLNLPGLAGLEVLARIKGRSPWARIPVVILTSSQAETDIAKSYDLHANCYVTKPLDFNQFITVVQSLEDYWFSLVKLPGRK